MKTVGEILSAKRKKKKVDIQAVAEATKIRPRFIKAIEKNDFNQLPSASTAYGFIKNYASYLRISSQYVLAIFRRDFYEDKKGKIIPRGLVKPLDSPKILRSPRIGLFLLTGLFIIALLVYLASQYFSLVRGPFLEVTAPQEKTNTPLSLIEVTGKTEPDATVQVNGQLTNVSSRGKFSQMVNLNEGKNLIVIEATSKFGRKKRAVREIFRQ